MDKCRFCSAAWSCGGTQDVSIAGERETPVYCVRKRACKGGVKGVNGGQAGAGGGARTARRRRLRARSMSTSGTIVGSPAHPRSSST
eukprot:544636-Prorocentrum_minimum.AAC.1